MLMSIPELKFIVLDQTIFLILIEPIMKNPIWSSQRVCLIYPFTVWFFTFFLRYSLRYAPIVYLLKVAILKGNFLMIPSEIKIEILAECATLWLATQWKDNP